jgi:DNA invertase Pin-like site-specific DNA recombinase
MADAHGKRFDAVVVWKFDRFARSVSDLLNNWAAQRRS